MKIKTLTKKMTRWLGISRQKDAKNDMVVSPLDNDQDSIVGEIALSDTDKRLMTLEEDFNRLLAVFESLKDNVLQQTGQNDKMIQCMEEMKQSLQALPGVLQNQTRTVDGLCQEIHKQNEIGQQIAGVIEQLPEENRRQLEQLDAINSKLADAAGKDDQQIEYVSRMGRHIQNMLEYQKQQADSHGRLCELMEMNEQYIQTVTRVQNRRLRNLFGLVGGVNLLIIAGIIFTLFL